MKMKKQWALLFLACGLVLTSALFTVDAQAKRLGGGKSFGRQNSGVLQRQQANPSPAAAPKQASPSPATAQVRQPSRWGGILGGLAAGIGLAALFHALGFGGGLASLVTALLLGGLVLFAVMAMMRLLRRQTSPMPQPVGMPRGAYDAGQLGQESYLPPNRFEEMGATGAGTPAASRAIPADFDQRAFLNKAREHYYQLQKAWDARDLTSLESYTTPELFVQLRGEIEQRGAERGQTDVVTLEAVLLELEERAGEYMATVEFSGLVREESWGGAQPMREIWNLAKPVSGTTGWLLAGIQQIG